MKVRVSGMGDFSARPDNMVSAICMGCFRSQSLLVCLVTRVLYYGLLRVANRSHYMHKLNPLPSKT